ncbi:MAG: polyprenyl synthetase family protein, partial [Oscillospiraceae bacterium]|nr:polyprenyl synthetase family protein [Oscillospiraceae bacterium]
IVYGETMAVLAGDALQAAAFSLLLSSDLGSEARAEGAKLLAAASGPDGMVAGQVLDLSGESVGREELELLHSLKTGALIAAAAELGCIAANATPMTREKARKYAKNLGLAFQIRDDMLDVIGDEATFGKPIGSDKDEEKTTFVDLLGLEGCEAEVKRLTEEAVAALDGLGDTAFLKELAYRMAVREK